jgi:hypothetical protein
MIKLQKLACQARGKGARRELNSQMHSTKNPLWAGPIKGAYVSKRESGSKITALGTHPCFRTATRAEQVGVQGLAGAHCFWEHIVSL